MQVNCRLCGGENSIHPGQEMLFCSYCGSALAVEEVRGPERLILPHNRNDRHAEEALRSFLASKSLASPKDIKLDFAYVPYTMLEDDRGHLIGQPGRSTWPELGPLSFPPAGQYRFFDESLAGEEKVFPHDEEPETLAAAARILFLPVYRVRYRASGKKYRALIMGESYYVFAEALPPERPAAVSMPNILAAAAMAVAYLFIGKLGHSTAARILVIMTAALAGWGAFSLKARIAGKSD
jgi:hypothetical protein